MGDEDKKKFYEMLILFSCGTMHDWTRLLYKYPASHVDEAIAKGYLEEKHLDKFGIPVYAITDLGKEVWE